LIASHASVDAIPVIVNGFLVQPTQRPPKRKTFADIDEDFEWPPRCNHHLCPVLKGEKITSFSGLEVLPAPVKPVVVRNNGVNGSGHDENNNHKATV